jgi:hypothetical protein
MLGSSSVVPEGAGFLNFTVAAAGSCAATEFWAQADSTPTPDVLSVCNDGALIRFPATADTLVGKATTDDLSNKSIVTAGLAFKNATSGTVTLNTVTGALGTVTASLPAKTGTIAVGPLVKSLTWFFPGTPATGQQAPRALVPEGVTGCTITNSRISVGTAAGSGSPAYNIARCTTSAGNCTATSNIYTSAVGLTTNQSVAGGAPNTATVTAGDAFKVDITNVGVTIADITVTMAYTCDQ